jgi:benzoyl-CoA reductase subunit B
MTELTSRARHDQLTQLAVTHSLRRYQREWWQELRARVDGGEPMVLAGANVPHEIFEALDLPFVTDVWYSGLVAAKRQSGYYSQVLDEHGYHEGLDRYAGLVLGVVLDEELPDKPWGGLPAPSLVVTMPPSGAAESVARHFGVPYLGLERPVATRPVTAWWETGRWNWEDLEESHRIDALVAQYRELVEACEKLAGRRLDVDRLREILSTVNAQEEAFDDVRTLLQTSPKLPVRLGEVMSQVMGIQWHRGTPWALDQARAFRDEVAARVEAEQWVCPNERFRLMYLGQGLWQQLDFFSEFEESHGVVFARSNYLSIACDAYPRYGLRDPLRTLAGRYATFNDYLHYPPWAGAWAVWESRTHRLNGAVQLDNGGHGTTFITRALETEGIPVLQFPTDAVDSRAWDEDRMRGLVTDFIEKRLEERGVR